MKVIFHILQLKYFDYRWRQLDFDIFNSDEFKNHIKENNIKIITWEDLKKLI